MIGQPAAGRILPAPRVGMQAQAVAGGTHLGQLPTVAVRDPGRRPMNARDRRIHAQQPSHVHGRRRRLRESGPEVSHVRYPSLEPHPGRAALSRIRLGLVGLHVDDEDEGDGRRLVAHAASSRSPS
ncbi:MAG: hypothetical protein ABR527_11900 [Gemmatimonadota bacterium]